MRSHTVALALERDGLVTEITALLDRVSAALPVTGERPSAGSPGGASDMLTDAP